MRYLDLSRSIGSCILAVAVSFTSGIAFANDTAKRDAELMDALRTIATRDSQWTAQDWHDFRVKAARNAVLVGTVTTAGVAAYYLKLPRGFKRKSFGLSKDSLVEAGRFFNAHGGKVIIGVALPVIVPLMINGVLSIMSLGNTERLRSAATPDARVYRSHLRQFFRLSLSEQFLIARQDEVFTDDLIRLAKWIDAGSPGEVTYTK